MRGHLKNAPDPCDNRKLSEAPRGAARRVGSSGTAKAIERHDPHHRCNATGKPWPAHHRQQSTRGLNLQRNTPRGLIPRAVHQLHDSIAMFGVLPHLDIERTCVAHNLWG